MITRTPVSFEVEHGSHSEEKVAYATAGIIKVITATTDQSRQDKYKEWAQLTIEDGHSRTLEVVEFPGQFSELEQTVLLHQRVEWKRTETTLDARERYRITSDYELKIMTGPAAGKKVERQSTWNETDFSH